MLPNIYFCACDVGKSANSNIQEVDGGSKPVVRSKIMTPLRNTMDFINSKQRYSATFCKALKRFDQSAAEFKGLLFVKKKKMQVTS